MNCILCDTESRLFFVEAKSGRAYFHCPRCDLRFLDPAKRLSESLERARYETHQNDVTNPGYQNFVRPLYALIKNRIKSSASILDFGCGEGPVLTHLLVQDGYSISLYDPFFRPDTKVLQRKYDFVFAVEVIEHFYDPSQELGRLRELLEAGGALAVMTNFYRDEIDFKTWVYRNDKTHVCFYSAKTMEWIRARFGFASYEQIGERIGWYTI